ncbi:hypothetical protein AN396_00870 [Candidatus Epulonipiscium fishelsonii]|uniref:Uncharacterized protein n=1 Tax=Candidatus Epulonipiscium fishelsonii TaxID=77094 RepID=A0ACC8XDH0_9FIRM|nr:hypothetical protein AN396_00870 [Epulopiscium sp. SCG-B11WGA-EpuloA1]
MIKHIVFVKVKDKAELPKLKELFLSMKEHIPMIKEIEVGINNRPSPVAFDICLELCVDSLEALDEYIAHPYHAKTVMDYLNSIRTDLAVVDYDI